MAASKSKLALRSHLKRPIGAGSFRSRSTRVASPIVWRFIHSIFLTRHCCNISDFSSTATLKIGFAIRRTLLLRASQSKNPGGSSGEKVEAARSARWPAEAACRRLQQPRCGRLLRRTGDRVRPNYLGKPPLKAIGDRRPRKVLHVVHQLVGGGLRFCRIAGDDGAD